MVWTIELWIQPIPRYVARWLGWKCGPWFDFKTIWANRWEDIPGRAREEETGGLYHRLLLCCEEYAQDEDGSFVPVDQV